jgi:hypothetical protein
MRTTIKILAVGVLAWSGAAAAIAAIGYSPMEKKPVVAAIEVLLLAGVCLLLRRRRT